MKDWKECKLGEIATFINGRAYKATEFKEAGTPIIRIQNLTGTGNLVYSNLKLPDNKYIEKNDLIYAWSATFGPYIWKGVRGIFHYHIWKIECNQNIDKQYLYFHLLRTTKYMQESGNGTLFTHITKELMESFPILLPPLAEQKAIAGVLSSLDDKIDLLHRQNKTLEAMAEALFRQWFIEPCKDGLPEGWVEGYVSDLAVHLRDSAHPNKNPEIYFSHFSIPAFDNNKEPVIEKGSEIKSSKYQVSTNSILFSKLNPHKDKRVWLILNELPDNSICSTEFQVIMPKNNISLFFLYGWLTYTANYNEIVSGVGGTSSSHQRIDPKSIFDFQCVSTDTNYMIEYNNRVAPLFNKQLKNQTQIRTLEKLRDTLLPKLMSGEVRCVEPVETRVKI
ncbi:MAG: hypothetical protein LDLANPLL_00769 [Turneriella sp.]|nr:hypothetical protein [Turneriella sp.]